MNKKDITKIQYHVRSMLKLYSQFKVEGNPMLHHEYLQAIRDGLESLKQVGIIKSYNLKNYTFEI